QALQAVQKPASLQLPWQQGAPVGVQVCPTPVHKRFCRTRGAEQPPSRHTSPPAQSAAVTQPSAPPVVFPPPEDVAAAVEEPRPVDVPTGRPVEAPAEEIPPPDALVLVETCGCCKQPPARQATSTVNATRCPNAMNPTPSTPCRLECRRFSSFSLLPLVGLQLHRVEEVGNLHRGILGRVAAVNGVLLHVGGEVLAQRSGRGLGGIGGAHDLTVLGDGILALEHHGQNWP